MLTTIGGTPQVVDGFRALVYPGPLPGGVRPQLTVYLAGLSKLYIQQVYLQIEYPEGGPVPFALAPEETYPTIGNFYDKVLETFQRLKPNLSGERQLTYDDPVVELHAIKTLDDVERAVTQIKQQGEGTSQSPVIPGSMDNELAHYYKFAEILFERKLVQVNGKWDFSGDPIPFPPTYPVAPIPRGGYTNPPEIVGKALQKFNQLFADMVAKLQSAWSNGRQDDLDAAISMMFALSAAATPIMQIRLPDSSGVYGPDFRLPSRMSLSEVTMPVSFSKDVLPLFRKIDIDHMRKRQVLLDDYNYMSDPTTDHANARDVEDRLSTNDATLRMPPDLQWTAGQLKVYRQWMADGFQP
jgi:hypothetical protein